MKRVLLSLMIVGALVATIPASADAKDHTRRWGKPTPKATLWQAEGGKFSATRSNHQVTFTFANHTHHAISFFCVWHEKMANGSLQRRQWRGGVKPGKDHERGPHPTSVFPNDATCTLG